jgi:hypothetical protein
MTDTTNLYVPILDPIYVHQTYCSRNEAVEYLLGRLKVGVLRKNLIPDDAGSEELELYDFSWQTLMIEERESADAAYTNALIEVLADNVIAEALAKLTHCDSQINKAHRFLCDIDDELAKGQVSELRIDRLSNLEPTSPNITISSLAVWAKDRYGIDIINSKESEQTVELQQNQNTISALNLSTTKTQNLQITFALLIEAFAKDGSRYRHIDGRPNVSTIAQELVDAAKHDEKGLPGQSKKSIENAINAALSVKKEHS